MSENNPGLQAAGESLGMSMTPASVDTQPTPADLLQAAEAYLQAVIGPGGKVQSFRQTSTQPVIWEAEVIQGGRPVKLTAKRVPGGYKFAVG